MPDTTVPVIVDHIVDELAAAVAGSRADLRAASTSRYLGAVRALAGLAQRLPEHAAEIVLAHFEAQPAVEPNQHRYHDQDEAAIVAAIALSHPVLSVRAIPHLVQLLARSDQARTSTTMRAIDERMDLARALLVNLADQSRWARETLAAADPSVTPRSVAEAALERLTTPLAHQPGIHTVGTGAVADSILVMSLAPARLEPAVAELLARADDPNVGWQDRCDYLLAAANLGPTAGGLGRHRAFQNAMRCATTPTPAIQDQTDMQFSHKLGGIQVINPDNDTRTRALYVAAVFADDDAERSEVVKRAYDLLVETPSDYWVTRAFQRLGEALKEDVGFLTAQGWALRSLAGIIWAEHGQPRQLGFRLAHDTDKRVRRALAAALAEGEEREFQRDARARLAIDPCFSVRSTLNATKAP